MDAQFDKQGMESAIEIARRGIQAGQSPFGAVIARGKEVITVAHNRVWDEKDPTAHAEVNAIREACRKLGIIDLAGCTMYTTCEPCPMCFSAIHWAHCDRIVYGADIADAAAAGFRELSIPNTTMARLGGSGVAIEGGVLVEDARAQFREFAGRPDRRTY